MMWSLTVQFSFENFWANPEEKGCWMTAYRLVWAQKRIESFMHSFCTSSMCDVAVLFAQDSFDESSSRTVVYILRASNPQHFRILTPIFH